MSIFAELRHFLASSWRYGHGFHDGQGFLFLSLEVLYSILLLLPSTLVLLLSGHIWCAGPQNIQHEQRWTCHLRSRRSFPFIDRIERSFKSLARDR
jgi:hypothetical protein